MPGFFFYFVKFAAWGLYLTGEWALADCSVCKGDNVTLWFRSKKVHVDNKKIKMAAKKIFNITNLSSSDTGMYSCKENSQLVCRSTTVEHRKGKYFIPPGPMELFISQVRFLHVFKNQL